MASINSYASVPKPYTTWYRKGALSEFVDAGLATVEEAKLLLDYNCQACKMIGWKFEGWAFIKPFGEKICPDKYKVLGIVSKLDDKKTRMLIHIDGDSYQLLNRTDIMRIMGETANV